MSQCKTEVANGSAVQSWEWSGAGEAEAGFQELRPAKQGISWDKPLMSAGDSLWRIPVRTCQPELFTISRFGTITLWDEVVRFIVSRWELQDIKLWEAPAIRLETSLPATTGLFYSKVDFLHGIQGLVDTPVLREDITMWSLFWIFLNAQAKVIDSVAKVLYTNSNDSGWIEEGFWLGGIQGLLTKPKLVESIRLPSSKAKVEWFKGVDAFTLVAYKGLVDTLHPIESWKFKSVRYKSESVGIWEQVVYVAGYGKGSGYGYGDYGR